jgi:hypothetical protein
VSWDASLTIEDSVTLGDWNYTHNCSPMIYVVLDDAGVERPITPRPRLVPDHKGGWTRKETPTRVAWWAYLNGMSPKMGAEYLGTIVAGLEADPERFRAMNPPNGGGDYDSLLVVLREMLGYSRLAERSAPGAVWGAWG